jgi:hypothetical protein
MLVRFLGILYSTVAWNAYPSVSLKLSIRDASERDVEKQFGYKNDPKLIKCCLICGMSSKPETYPGALVTLMFFDIVVMVNSHQLFAWNEN